MFCTFFFNQLPYEHPKSYAFCSPQRNSSKEHRAAEMFEHWPPIMVNGHQKKALRSSKLDQFWIWATMGWECLFWHAFNENTLKSDPKKGQLLKKIYIYTLETHYFIFLSSTQNQQTCLSNVLISPCFQRERILGSFLGFCRFDPSNIPWATSLQKRWWLFSGKQMGHIVGSRSCRKNPLVTSSTKKVLPPATSGLFSRRPF